ncbi:Zip-domain-containing protein [Testicularia cyperi]|uniref:Zip-domain-containing protein n=1 Tax=Testicularia cyperi TaxID=1882483 RepID=A0A317XW50_9BASI|nr:Zip-domain-containing protein [Testicularia cyperi]
MRSSLFKIAVGAVALGATLASAGSQPTPTQLRKRQADGSFVTAVTVSGTVRTVTAEPSPTGLGACVFHINHWDCEGATGAQHTEEAAAVSATATATSAAAAVEPSPTGLGECHLHGDHWHCEGQSESAEDHSGHDHGSSDSHAGHDHAGHSHGPSAEYGCGLAPLASYDLPLHIGAVFILLLSSVVGTYSPIALNRNGDPSGAGGNRIFAELFFICRHFGTGVILSTAFIHLLSHAMLYFANECVGELQYESTAPAIAMAAVWLVFIIDFFLLRSTRAQARAFEAQQRAGSNEGEKSSIDSEMALERQSMAENKVQEWDVAAMEAGIIFHSILIGVTLGVATGSGFVALLITIVFHQFFEGLALGSRISLLARRGLLFKCIMGAAYCLTTPLGIAIGIGVRNSFNGNGQATLITMGTLHAVSAGILLYTALVELMSGDFIHGKALKNASLARSIAAIVALTIGAAAMSVLGKWA